MLDGFGLSCLLEHLITCVLFLAWHLWPFALPANCNHESEPIIVFNEYFFLLSLLN
ncbi:hypothetical protein Hanom_Chr09g00848531 [Helianthus anomalus]